MTQALVAGLMLGLAAGLAPGPMLVLTVAQALRHGPRGGLRVAAAPLLTDAPIIAVTLLVLVGFARMRTALGALAVFGSAYLISLAWEAWCSPPIATPMPPAAGGLRRAMLTNFLNPHPYLFWAAAGGPFMLDTLRSSGVGAAAAFIGAFYLMLVGAKALLAVLIGRHQSLLAGRGFRYTQRFLALGLVLFALWLLHDGLGLLGMRG